MADLLHLAPGCVWLLKQRQLFRTLGVQEFSDAYVPGLGFVRKADRRKPHAFPTLVDRKDVLGKFRLDVHVRKLCPKFAHDLIALVVPVENVDPWTPPRSHREAVDLGHKELLKAISPRRYLLSEFVVDPHLARENVCLREPLRRDDNQFLRRP